MTTDDFENPDSSPLPPYDRNWRHPAEVADTERSRHLGVSPPLGRRLTALTVIASVLTSLAVLTVAIPKGIEGYTQNLDNDVIANSDTLPVATTVPSVKGSGLTSISGLYGLNNATSALSLGNRTWLVASEDITMRKVSAAYGASFSVLRENKEMGLSVIRINSGVMMPAVTFDNIDEQLTSEELPDCRIVDAFQVHTLASEPSLDLQPLDDSHPVNMETSVKGLAVVLNNQQEIVGVVVRNAHAHRIVPKKALFELAAR